MAVQKTNARDACVDIKRYESMIRTKVISKGKKTTLI